METAGSPETLAHIYQATSLQSPPWRPQIVHKLNIRIICYTAINLLHHHFTFEALRYRKHRHEGNRMTWELCLRMNMTSVALCNTSSSLGRQSKGVTNARHGRNKKRKTH